MLFSRCAGCRSISANGRKRLLTRTRDYSINVSNRDGCDVSTGSRAEVVSRRYVCCHPASPRYRPHSASPRRQIDAATIVLLVAKLRLWIGMQSCRHHGICWQVAAAEAKPKTSGGSLTRIGGRSAICHSSQMWPTLANFCCQEKYRVAQERPTRGYK